MNKVRKIILMIWMVMITCMMIQATEKLVGEGRVINPKRTEQPPKIDGKLDDPAWQGAPTTNDPFITNSPVYGEVLDQKTEVWVTYDYDNLYFAFYCHDTEPDKIKTSVSRRDSIFSDDWVGVDIDTMGKRQFAYIILSNANGIQGDLLTTASGGETAEPDWVWYSAVDNSPSLKRGDSPTYTGYRLSYLEFLLRSGYYCFHSTGYHRMSFG